jgi:glycolate oxidase iron-sulfur subunit
MVREHLKSIHDLIDRCFRCGLCRAVCPVFLEVGQEPAVARGKVQLVGALLAGEMEPSDGMAHLLSRCLTCGLCEQTCPADVPVTEIVLSARNELVSAQDLIRAGKTAPFPAVSRWARYLRKMGSSPEQPLTAILGLLSQIHGGIWPRSWPHISSKKMLGKIEPSQVALRVGYFPGCAQFVYPRITRAVMDVLEANDVMAIVPEGLVCCGWPFMEAGDFSAAGKLVQANIKAFEGHDIDAIVVSCAAGNQVLKRYYAELLGLKGFSAPVYDIAGFLLDVLPGPLKASPLPKNCGGSLFFSAVHPELSRTILDRRLQAVARVDCDAVITDSPACMMQLEWALESRGMSQKVMHLAEVLVEAFGVGRSLSAETK